MQKKLSKSSTDRVVAGVCGGIAEYFGLPSLVVRIIFLVFFPSLIAYIILAYLLPEGSLYL
ncbi:PspC domain-containing protein [Sporosarcina cascadiensis]|uniref:PspC domain-containing protein n=1 Tax=Sporosarcina cascadiensis TaxID=2660747 RepID=UPI00129A466A|nr:PspC domain-containing protein [Sporosarcina cascadiensis]